MTRITRQGIEAACMERGQFAIPDNIKSAIENSITNTVGALDAEYSRLSDEYKKYRTLMAPAKIDYHGIITLEAYIAYYLARNMVIPWIALRDLSMHPSFHTLPDELNVLDLGSGTGAIPLGLLHLFHCKPFSTSNISIVAVDGEKEALERQKALIRGAGFSMNKITTITADLSKAHLPKTMSHGPFNFIFVANCFTELEIASVKDLLPLLSGSLTEDGAIIIAEAQRNYIKAMVGELARTAGYFGLSVFYPCPTFQCNGAGWCWVWRDHQYRFPELRINGQPLLAGARERLTLSWLVLTKQQVSAYDSFKKKDGKINWGPIARLKSRDMATRIDVEDLGQCDGSQVVGFARDSDVSDQYDRGNVVGLSPKGKIRSYFDLS